MITVNIKKSWFYSAGRTYKWVDEGYDIRGVGIEVGLIKNNSELEIVVDKVKYHLLCDDAITFIRRFNSIFNANGTRVAIVSKSLLKTISEPSEGSFKATKKTIESPAQQSLF